MLNDYEICKICVTLYNDQSAFNGYWSKLWPINGGYAAIRQEGDTDVVVWRGSTTAYDWILNLKADPEKDGSLGYLHHGFAEGVWKIQDEVMNAIRKDATVIITGHSRGAAQAAIFAGEMIAHGYKVDRVVLMGCPRPGEKKLASVLKRTTVANYKNGQDFVTKVPFYIDLIGSLFDAKFVKVSPYIKFSYQLANLEEWPGDIEYHHWENYLYGIAETVLAADDPDRIALEKEHTLKS